MSVEGLVFDELKHWPFIQSCSSCALAYVLPVCVSTVLHISRAERVFMLDIEGRNYSQRCWLIWKAG